MRPWRPRQTLTCPTCRRTIRTFGQGSSGRRKVACQACGAVSQVWLFPAFRRDFSKVDTGEGIIADDECQCFFHEDKRAVRACDRCGRFICALCDVVFGSENLCPQCVASGQKKEGKRADNSRILYGHLALYITLFASLTVWGTFVSAPAVLVMCFFYWKKPGPTVGSDKWQFVLAGFLSLIQLAVWVALLGGLAFAMIKNL
ncbi:MAG: hypothetical protein RRC34_08430 [Lentisphaeria bacterium]|nr:hypothetical protein [Lentisphaeria bacterium]